MREIPLTQGKIAFIDDEDYEKCSRHKWHAHRNYNTFYAMTTYPENRYLLIRMHRVIMNTPSFLIVHHKDTNGLNNQKHNLENCTNTLNQLKARLDSKGIKQKGNRFQAFISLSGYRKYLGTFNTFDEAVTMHRAARERAIENEYKYIAHLLKETV